MDYRPRPIINGQVNGLHQSAAGTLVSEPQRVRILVADDDPATARLLFPIGVKEGYQIVCITDGREAYRILKSDADFAAVVFNMSMPNLEGLDLVRYMKTEERLQRIPVITAARTNDLKLMASSFAAGAVAFLPKPITAGNLARTLSMTIGRAARR